MFVQIITYEGPDSDGARATALRAAQERVDPLIYANPDLLANLLGGFSAALPDGGEVIISLARTEEAMKDLLDLAMNTESWPGEDGVDFPAPSRVERLPVTQAYGPWTQLQHQPAS